MKLQRAAIYTRVSLTSQDTAAQRAEVSEFVARRGWEPIHHCVGGMRFVVRDDARTARLGRTFGMQTAQSKQARARRKRADTTLIFDPAQKVPGQVLDGILQEWLVPTLVEQFLRERGITRESLLTRYRSNEL